MLSIKLLDRLGTDISSRRAASILREEIIQTIKDKQGPVVLDLSGIECISHSFLDGVFGVIVQDFGNQWFRDNIRVLNIPYEIRKDLLAAIQLRIQERSNATTSD